MSHTEYVPMIVRRKVLESSVGGLTALVAGCTGSSTPDATDHVEDWHEDAVRGDGDPIEIERSVDESDRFETRCHWVGRERLRAVLDERLDQRRICRYTSRRNPGPRTSKSKRLGASSSSTAFSSSTDPDRFARRLPLRSKPCERTRPASST